MEAENVTQAIVAHEPIRANKKKRRGTAFTAGLGATGFGGKAGFGGAAVAVAPPETGLAIIAEDVPLGF